MLSILFEIFEKRDNLNKIWDLCLEAETGYSVTSFSKKRLYLILTGIPVLFQLPVVIAMDGWANMVHDHRGCYFLLDTSGNNLAQSEYESCVSYEPLGLLAGLWHIALFAVVGIGSLLGYFDDRDETSNSDYGEIRGSINFGLLCNIILVFIFFLYAPEFYSSVDTLRTRHETFLVGYDSPEEPPMLLLNILAFLPWLYVYFLSRRSDENRAQ